MTQIGVWFIEIFHSLRAAEEEEDEEEDEAEEVVFWAVIATGFASTIDSKRHGRLFFRAGWRLSDALTSCSVPLPAFRFTQSN